MHILNDIARVTASAGDSVFMPRCPNTQSSAGDALCRSKTLLILIILSFFGSLSFCHMFGNRKTNKGRKEIKEERETRSDALLLSFPTQGSWLYVHWRWSPMKSSAAESCWTVVDLAASASQPLPAAGTASMPPSGWEHAGWRADFVPATSSPSSGNTALAICRHPPTRR